jgi:hypothetical protein
MKDKSNQRFNLLDGYFQWVLSQEDFNDMTSLLRKMLINPTQLSIAKNSCVIHIRGTDFISLGWADEQQKYFYQKAIEYLNRNFGITRFEICTDDMPFAKSILEDKNFSFNFAKRRLAEDFFLIANCSKRIISSSTFAFWASALGTNDNSVTIAQNFWFPGKPREIYLPGELQLNL